MNKNEIALSFEQAEYYTLKEACDYLNMKHGTTNITVKKILQNILKYETNTYFYAKGFNIAADLIAPLFHELDKEQRDYAIKHNHYISDLLDTVVCDGDGLLLLLTKEFLERFRFSDIAKFYGEEGVFCGALNFDRLQDNPFYLGFLEKYINRAFLNGLLAIYPHFYKYSDDDWGDIFAKSSLKVDSYDLCDNDNTDKEIIYAFCKISINDLIVLHKDLMELENNIIKNNPAPQKQLEIKPKKGVSIHKLQAKEQAKIIAKALWNNDKDDKIKIAEMARLVYSELYDNGFNSQLPQNQESLQDWIRDIAPTYATTGGRPKNEP